MLGPRTVALLYRIPEGGGRRGYPDATQSIRTAAELPFEAPLYGPEEPPVYPEIAAKALQRASRARQTKRGRLPLLAAGPRLQWPRSRRLAS